MAGIPFVTGRYFVPATDVAYRKVEEGLHVVPPPPKQTGARMMSLATYNFIKIAIRSCTTVLGIGILVYLFVSRFVYKDPLLQDPFKMVAHVVLALVFTGTGYITALDQCDEEMIDEGTKIPAMRNS